MSPHRIARCTRIALAYAAFAGCSQGSADPTSMPLPGSETEAEAHRGTDDTEGVPPPPPSPNTADLGAAGAGASAFAEDGTNQPGDTDPIDAPASDTASAGMPEAGPAAGPTEATAEGQAGEEANEPGIDPNMEAGAELDSPETTVDTVTPDGTETPAPQRPKPACLQSGSQVVLLGDSYINWLSHSFPADLNREAGQTFRMYAVGGYSMGSGGIGPIPPQLDQAISDDPDITTIVMDGGGNDILVPDVLQFPRGGECKESQMAPMIPDCQMIVAKALEAAEQMLTTGVSQLEAETVDVVYFFYPNVPEGTLVGGAYPNAILEYSAPMVKDFCDSTYERSEGKVMCHFVDLRPVFEGHPEYFAPADIHPNNEGSAAMAQAIWQTMQDNCLAQPESSGCCQP
ncbi:MAG: SGNH/GDSL hydrolase family protein [Myxococcales bacterium]|nr:SGNH/GDSL hydrolase family protein [Myxococcales bacterium]MDD9965154.1 SGNH/GDSL hydrolase family protein [Myxococcales bacterium]